MSRSNSKRQEHIFLNSQLPDDAELPLLELNEQSMGLFHEIYGNAPSFTDMQDFVHEFVKASDAKVVDSVTIDGPSEGIIIERPDGAQIRLYYEDLATAKMFLANYRNSTSPPGASFTQKVESGINPPKRAEILLHFGLPKRDRECMVGDLEEEYRTVILPKYGARVAARWYWWQAVRSVIAASGGRIRVWLSFGDLARAAGWIVEKFTL